MIYKFYNSYHVTNDKNPCNWVASEKIVKKFSLCNVTTPRIQQSQAQEFKNENDYDKGWKSEKIL